MNDWDSPELPDELRDVAARIREQRHTATPLELDELKRRAFARADAAERAPRSRLNPRARLAGVLLVGGLAASATSAGVLAGTSSSVQSPSASLSQYEGEILGAQAVSGTARLSARAGCPKRPYYARVTGRNIRSIVFRLDRRVIRRVTVRRPTDVNRTFRVRIRPSRLSTGVHRLTARVAWAPATGRAARTFRVPIVRCARRAIVPRFTG